MHIRDLSTGDTAELDKAWWAYGNAYNRAIRRQMIAQRDMVESDVTDELVGAQHTFPLNAAECDYDILCTEEVRHSETD